MEPVSPPGSGPEAEGAGVLLIGFDPSHTSRVLRGENAGRTLDQANVVRSIRDLGAWSGVSATFEAAAPAGETAAILLQATDGRILGAARLGERVAGAAELPR